MKTFLSFAAAGLAVLASGSAVQAQHGHGHGHGGFGHGHGFGHGGYGHGHGHFHGHVHYWPHTGYYGSYGYAYPYTYGSVWSYPTYYYPSVVTNPVVASPTPAAGVTSSSSLRPNALSPYTGPGVMLRLPAEFPDPVYVRIDNREVELKPGTEVALKDKASYVVEFDRGGEFGSARFELKEGVYKMAVGDKGWEVVTDAPANGGLRRNALPGEPKK